MMKYLLGGLVAAPLLFAQATGRIEGTVGDAVDAAVEGARVTCVAQGTGLRHETITSHEGIFRFPELPIGLYTVSVTRQGFSTLREENVELLTARTVSLKLRLEVGSVSESVHVKAEVSLVQPTTSEVQTTIDARAMSDLPLNGRNPLDLVVLSPGADYTSLGTSPGQQDNTGVTVNGLRAVHNNFQLDGAGFNNLMYASAPTLPNPDSLGEFTAQTSNFSARESGGGAVVQLSTKSGTNRYTGSFFNFLRNEKMDARNFFAVEPSEFKRNQFGASFGGPIRRDRIFFFTSYQGTVKRGSPSPKRLTVPSLAQREGIFPAANAITDPANGQPFPNNIVPRSRWNPNTTKLTESIPLPNAGTNIAQLPTSSNSDDHQGVVKIDYQIKASNNLSVRYYHDRNLIQRDTASLRNVYAMNDYRNKTLTGRSTINATARVTLVNSVSYTRTFRDQTPNAPFYTTDVAPGVVPANERALPELRLNLANYFNLNSGGPLQFHPHYIEWRNQTAWAKGTHLIAFGVDFKKNMMDAMDNSIGSGAWAFAALQTANSAGRGGDTWASYILGAASTFQQTASDLASLGQKQTHLWFHDDWKIRPRLTLNLGVRWEPAFWPHDTRGPLAGFQPGRQSKVAPFAPVGLVFSGDVPRQVVPADWNNVAPRAGFAWDVTGSAKTVIRGGYGIYYLPVAWATTRIGGTNGPFRTLSVTVNVPPSFEFPYRTHPGGNPFPYKTPSAEQMSTFRFQLPLATGQVLDPTQRTGYTQSWNLTIERQILRDTAVSIGYIGNHSLGILAGLEANPAIYGPTATAANINDRRIYKGLASVQMNTGWQWGNYHSLLLTATKRTRTGLNVVANFTWSKSIDPSSGGGLGGFNWQSRDPFNRHFDKGAADTDAKYRLNLMLVYDVPRIRQAPRAVGFVVNGWQANGIFTARTGYPFNVLAGSRALNGGNTDYADLVGDAARPAGADPVHKWFNTAAFVLPPLGTIGTLGRNAIRGPGSAVLNFSTFKNFKPAERFTVQYRFEAFNAFNHANFNTPAGADANNSVGGVNFGRLMTAADPRVLQMGLKLLF